MKCTLHWIHFYSYLIYSNYLHQCIFFFWSATSNNQRRMWHWDWRVQNKPPQNVPLWQVDYFGGKNNQGPEDSGRVFNLLLNCLKNPDWAPGSDAELLPRDNFYQKDQSVWQGKHLITKHLLFLSPVSCHPPLPLEALGPVPSLSSEHWISLSHHSWLWVSWILMYTITFFLLLISRNLIIRPAKEPWRGRRYIFSSPTQSSK